jgi:iron complex outermembrane receptor protein
VQGALQNVYIYGPTNIGSLESKGVDLGLNVVAVKSNNLDLSFNYNVTYNHIEITDLFSDNLPVGSLGDGLYSQTQKVGLAPNSFWVYQQLYDQDGRPIEGAYADRNNDGQINSSDRYNYHKPQPDVTMGFLTNATFYKNWDFSMAWRASIGNYVYDQVSANRSTLNGIFNSQSNIISNTTTDYSNTYFTAAVKESDYYVKNGSFLKLDNLTLGYNFRDIFNTKSKTSLRLYGGVQNVLTITKYKGMDPEVFNNGIDGTIFPRSRMYMLGINANF